MHDRVIRTKHIDGGDDRVFYNVMGNPVQSKDAKGTKVTTTYDQLHRPLSKHVYNTTLSLDNMVEYLIYGEGVTDAALYNLKGKLYCHYDQAGRVTISQYSFRGEPKITERKVRTEYKAEANWPASIPSRDALLETESYTTQTENDALGRLHHQVNPDTSETKPEYHLSGNLNKVTTKLKGETTYTEQVTSITYNPKGQRERITYGNGTYTDYTYEATTYRLKTLVTTRTSDSKVLQNISYTYDPAGNITIVNDASVPAVFSNNQQVQAKQKFTYNSLYRLITAEGREHTGLNNPDYYKDTNAYKQSAFISITDPNDDNRLANYTRYYTYNKAGNMLTVQHVAADSQRSFTRTIRVEEDSNRWLPANMGIGLTIGDYYDENGNIQELETLLQVNWNYRDNISNGVTVERTGNINDAEYYVYDASGQRIRKVKETLTSVVNNTVEIEEKIYTSNVETKKIRVVQGGSTTILTRTSLHVMDDTRRIATVHNWTVDTLEREINAQGELNTNKIRYQYGNHIDSASLELSSTGAIISYEEYFPYGDTSFMAGTSQKEVKIKEYRYTGKEKDDATGLYYYGARYYASWLGRWMSCDPLFRENPSVYDRPKGSTAEEQQRMNEEYMQKLYHEGLNMYGYVKGNPVTFSDPSGNYTIPYGPIVHNINNFTWKMQTGLPGQGYQAHAEPASFSWDNSVKTLAESVATPYSIADSLFRKDASGVLKNVASFSAGALVANFLSKSDIGKQLISTTASAVLDQISNYKFTEKELNHMTDLMAFQIYKDLYDGQIGKTPNVLDEGETITLTAKNDVGYETFNNRLGIIKDILKSTIDASNRIGRPIIDVDMTDKRVNQEEIIKITNKVSEYLFNK